MAERFDPVETLGDVVSAACVFVAALLIVLVAYESAYWVTIAVVSTVWPR